MKCLPLAALVYDGHLSALHCRLIMRLPPSRDDALARPGVE